MQFLSAGGTPEEREIVPIRILIAGYVFTLVAAILGCAILARTRHARRGIWWIIGGLASALTTMLLWAGIGYFSGFTTIVIANEMILLAFVLLHQAVASVLESSRRHIPLGMVLLIAQFGFFLYFYYVTPSIQDRVLVRTVTVFIQVLATTHLLFRHRESGLQFAARTAGAVLAFFALLQASQFAVSLLWAPSLLRLRPTPLSSFYYIFNFMVGMGCWFAVVWLAICEKRQSLQLMATTDGLTGLLNRTAFDDILKRELRPGNRRRAPLALLLIDIDHFKAINDRYGHAAGDDVIRRISALLRDNMRTVDSVARYGGEEFAILLNGIGSDQAEVIAERLRLQIEQIAGLPQKAAVTASIGIALLRESDTVESIFKRSDEALYLSKHLGRNRVSALEFTYEEP